MKKPADIHGQLLGLRTGQEHTVIESIQEPLGAHPFSPFHQFLLHDGDLTGRASEADEAELQPEAQGLREGRMGRVDGVFFRGRVRIVLLMM